MSTPTATPRTLKAAGNPPYDWEATAERLFIEAQKLETELAAAKAECERLREAGTDTWGELREQIHAKNAELAAEREKVRVLREVLESLAYWSRNNTETRQTLRDRIAAALAATKEDAR